ncbi:hypothetical protein NKJ14_32705 [Mesorhizobium sp. M0199]
MLDALFQVSILISVAAATIRIATPLLLAAIGELIAERSGVYNMGLEGMMLMGAFTGYLAAYESGSLWLGVLAAGFTGALMALVFAVLVITLKVDGLAVNLLGAGLSTWAAFRFRWPRRDADHPILRRRADTGPERCPGARPYPLRPARADLHRLPDGAGGVAIPVPDALWADRALRWRQS